MSFLSGSRWKYHYSLPAPGVEAGLPSCVEYTLTTGPHCPPNITGVQDRFIADVFLWHSKNVFICNENYFEVNLFI